MGPRPRPAFDRFCDHVLVGDGCWMWTGSTSGGGSSSYGKLDIAKGKRVGAHRAAWELFRGPIPKGLYVLHRCDTMGCVKPSHLYVGTQADNVRDMVARERHTCPLSRDEVETIRFLYGTGRWTYRELADAYRVGTTSIGRYLKGERMSNDPNETPPVCPSCGGTSEDFAGLGNGDPEVFGFDWECPCGALLSDNDLVSVEDYRRSLR